MTTIFPWWLQIQFVILKHFSATAATWPSLNLQQCQFQFYYPKMAENTSWLIRISGLRKIFHFGHRYGCWCPGAPAPGYQHPKCWLRDCCTRTVSCVMRYGFFLKWISWGSKINSYENWPACLRIKICNQFHSRSISFQKELIIYVIWYQNWFLIF